MTTRRILALLLTTSLFIGTASPVMAADTGKQDMYRLYNPNSGEHFYTAKNAEKDNLVRAGWNYEGTGWVAPKSGDPVYRLYNPHSGDHHYTVSVSERNSLVRAGWKSEGIGWYSGGDIPVYRQYNPHAKSGSHNYTTSKSENDNLIRAGWKGEGIGWKCVEKGKTVTASTSNPANKADRKISNYTGYHDLLVQLTNEKIREFSGVRLNDIYSGLTYTLYDLTGDGIKELIVSWRLSSAGSYMEFYSYNGKKVTKLEIADGLAVGRHEEIRPCGKDIVYNNVNFGVMNVAKVHWNGKQLKLNWVASKNSWEANDNWYNDVYKSLHCGAPLKMYPANDFSLLRNS